MPHMSQISKINEEKFRKRKKFQTIDSKKKIKTLSKNNSKNNPIDDQAQNSTEEQNETHQTSQEKDSNLKTFDDALKENIHNDEIESKKISNSVFVLMKDKLNFEQDLNFKRPKSCSFNFRTYQNQIKQIKVSEVQNESQQQQNKNDQNQNNENLSKDIQEIEQLQETKQQKKLEILDFQINNSFQQTLRQKQQNSKNTILLISTPRPPQNPPPEYKNPVQSRYLKPFQPKKAKKVVKEDIANKKQNNIRHINKNSHLLTTTVSFEKYKKQRLQQLYNIILEKQKLDLLNQKQPKKEESDSCSPSKNQLYIMWQQEINERMEKEKKSQEEQKNNSSSKQILYKAPSFLENSYTQNQLPEIQKQNLEIDQDFCNEARDKLIIQYTKYRSVDIELALKPEIAKILKLFWNNVPDKAQKDEDSDIEAPIEVRGNSVAKKFKFR